MLLFCCSFCFLFRCQYVFFLILFFFNILFFCFFLFFDFFSCFNFVISLVDGLSWLRLILMRGDVQVIQWLNGSI